MSKLFDELKRRKVFRVAVIYGVVAWLLIQVADTIAPMMNLPESAPRLVLFLLIILFPVSLFLAWAYELTPEGAKSDFATQPATTSSNNTDRKLIFATFALVLLVAGFQIADSFFFGIQPAVTPSSAGTATGSGISPRSLDSVTRVSVRIPDDEFFDPVRGDFDMSADGKVFVYRGRAAAGTPILWMRRWNELSGRPVPNTENASRPKISPDGLEVVFNAGSGTLKVASLQGGLTRTLVSAGADTPDWSPDGAWFYYSSESNLSISRVPSKGGPEEAITNINQDNGEQELLFPETLPGNHLIFAVRSNDESYKLQTWNADTGQKKDLTAGNYPIYSPSGHLLFQTAEGATLMAAPFDLEMLDFTGPALPIAESLLLLGTGRGASVAVSDAGRLIYRTGNVTGRFATPVWVDRTGVVSEIIPDWQTTTGGGTGIPSLSPQGDRIAVASGNVNDGATPDIWIGQLDGLLSRITFGDLRAVAPSWAPDGKSVLYTGFLEGLYRTIWTKNADGSGFTQQLFESEYSIRKGFFSNDGEWIIYREVPEGAGSGRIRALKPNADYELVTLVDTNFDADAPALSPDGRWLAYNSDESGQWEIYVQPFPDVNSGRWQVTINGGAGPMWSHSGEELFYINDADELVAVNVDSGPVFRSGAEQVLFNAENFALPQTAGNGTLEATYDVSADGQRFLMMRLGQAADSELIMVDNWFAELGINGASNRIPATLPKP